MVGEVEGVTFWNRRARTSIYTCPALFGKLRRRLYLRRQTTTQCCWAGKVRLIDCSLRLSADVEECAIVSIFGGRCSGGVDRRMCVVVSVKEGVAYISAFRMVCEECLVVLQS